MKRSAPDNPKMYELCEYLHIKLYEAVGILELLWHFTAKYAEQGDIGRHTDKAIARAIGWRASPAKLVDALVACRWLDRDPKHRLLVHHWQQHADECVRKNLKNHGLTFLEPFQNDSATSLAPAQNDSSLPEPSLSLPKPEPSHAMPITLPPDGGEAGEPKPRSPKQQEHDALWEALKATTGLNPTTKNEQKRMGQAVRDLLLKQAVPSDVAVRAENYRLHMPNATLTLEAIVKHWDLCAKPPPPKLTFANQQQEQIARERDATFKRVFGCGK